MGSDNTTYEKTLGKHGCGTINDNGERLVNTCQNNNLIVGNTIFPHKNIHKLTWKSPDGRTVNQIDYVIINGKWRRSLKDVRVYRGADINSDHYLVVAAVKLKWRKNQTNQQIMKIDIQKLKSHETAKKFQIELRNRFDALADDTDTVQTEWDNIKTVYTKTAEKILGVKKK